MADPIKPPADLNATEARGGSRGGIVRTMLVASVALVTVAFIVVYLLFA